MRPLDIQAVGEELAIRWSEGREDYLRLETLRRHCPCAGCQGETDIMGALSKGPEQSLSTPSFRLVRFSIVGGYGIQPVWGDGHSTGIYSYDYLRRLAEAAEGC